MEWRVRRRHSVALIWAFTVIRPRQRRACARIQATIGRHQTRVVRRFLSKLPEETDPTPPPPPRYLVSATVLDDIFRRWYQIPNAAHKCLAIFRLENFFLGGGGDLKI